MWAAFIELGLIAALFGLVWWAIRPAARKKRRPEDK